MIGAGPRAFYKSVKMKKTPEKEYPMKEQKMIRIRNVVLSLLVVFAAASFGQSAKVPPTPEQKMVLDKDSAIPVDQAAVKIENKTTSPNFGKPQESFMSKHQAFLERRSQPMDILFIGDSITAGWESKGAAVWKKYFADPYNAADFGISGDRVQHVIWRIENGELDGVKPKAVIVMIGTNNSAHNTPEEIAAGVAKIVGMIHDKIPGTKVILLNLLPRSEKPGDSRRKIMLQTNEILATMDNGKDTVFLRLWDPFLDANGILRADLMPDFLHPNEAGYQIMADAIQAKLATLM